MLKRSFCASSAALALLATVGCVAPVDTNDSLDEDGPVADNVLSFEEYMDMGVRLVDPETDTYLVEGDIKLRGIDAVRDYYEESVLQPGALTMYNISGTDKKWGSSKKQNLTYCVNWASFGGYADDLESALDAAILAWERAVDVNFVHDATQDSNCSNTNTNVVFDVQYKGSGKSGDWITLASAFFPNDVRSDRVLEVYTEMFTGVSDQSPAGILKHELGHALGFRHEHIWMSCSGITEGTSDTRQLTEYDVDSVMHYRWCSGSTSDYELSPLDLEGAQSIYGATTFTYVRPNNYNDLKGDKTNIYVGDFNGDGKDDFLRQEKGSWDDDSNNTANVYLSAGDGTFTITTLSEGFDLKGDYTNLYIGDFNGDGKDDFLRQEKGSWDDDSNNTANVFLSSGNGSFTKVTLSESFALKGDKTNLYIGDFNGDGKDDIFRQEKDTWDDDENNTANVLLSTGNGGFTKIVLSESFDLKGDYTNLYVGDFDGDGKDDILRQEKGAWDDNGVNTANVLLSTGNGGFTKIVLSEDYQVDGDLTRLYVGDFNGDGKADFLRQEKGAWDDDSNNTAHIFFSTGAGTFSKVTLSESYDLKGDLTNLYIGDINGDGKDDILRQEKGAWDDNDVNTGNALISKGTGSFTKWVLSESYDIKGDYTNIFVGDFDGDGKSDFLRQEKGSWDDDSYNTAAVLFSTL